MFSLYLISEKDGRESLATLTQELTKTASVEAIDFEQITVDLVLDKLHNMVMPSPDLLLVLGPELKFLGYPPVHLRSAEIRTAWGKRCNGYPAFNDALRTFSTAERREGK